MLRFVYILIAAVVFSAAFVALMPAGAAYRWLAPESVRLTGVKGTLWSGEALLGSVDQLGFHNLVWDMNPMRLLLGRVSGDLSMSVGGGFVEGEVSAGLGGSMSASNLRGGSSIAGLGAVLPVSGLGGTVRFNLDSLQVEDGWPTGAVGVLNVEGLSAAMLGAELLGNYRVQLVESARDEGVVGQIKDAGGPLEVEGTLQLQPDRSYLLAGTVKTRPTASAQLRNGLRLLGSPAADGSRRFELSGTL